MIQRILIAGFCLAAFTIGCSNTENNNDSMVTRTVAVRTAIVEESDFPVRLSFGGTLRGDRQTMIPARVTTTVTAIPVNAGQAVAKGEILVRLDPGGVQSQFRQAEAVYLNAEKQFKKMQALYESGAIAESQLDAAETQFKVAQADFDAARQSVEIIAPFSGVVTDIYVRVGDEIHPGSPIVEIANTGALRLKLDIPSTQIGQIATGQTVSVTAQHYTGMAMTGTVISTADAASRDTRSFEVECRFDSPSVTFAPGMYVTAEIETKTLIDAVVVPNDAILYRTGQALVYLVVNDTVTLVPVTIVAPGQDQTAVAGALQSGQKVVVVGQKNLTPGTPVREAAI